MLKIEGKYLYLRAKLAHFVGHLPPPPRGSMRGSHGRRGQGKVPAHPRGVRGLSLGDIDAVVWR